MHNKNNDLDKKNIRNIGSFASYNQILDNNSIFNNSRFIPIIHNISLNPLKEPQSFRSSIMTHIIDQDDKISPQIETEVEYQNSYNKLKYLTIPSQMNYNSNYLNYGQEYENTNVKTPSKIHNNFEFRIYNTMPKNVRISHEDEVDELTNLLVQSMEAVKHPDFYGVCYKCGHAIVGGEMGCSAMDRTYHIKCFTCSNCYNCLKNFSFFVIGINILCEDCYMNSLEKCFICCRLISERLIRTRGQTYHSRCFKCVECDCSLDGMPFTLDSKGKVYCIGDYQRKCAVRCSICQLPITQLATNSEQMIQIIALKRNFHVGCYRCEDCNMQLSLEIEDRGCFPLNGRILCRICNTRRKTISTRAS